MPLLGTAFIAMWHDLAHGHAPEYERWHTVEHVPERVGIPGFLRGTRAMNPSGEAPHAFILYELSHLEVVRSPTYLTRLNDPTPWTHAVGAGMTNFLRCPCTTLLSLGHGVAGSVATLRISFPDASTPARVSALRTLTLETLEADGVTGASLGQNEAALGAIRTNETDLRPNPSTEQFDFVLLIEGLDAALVQQALQRAQNKVLAQGAHSAIAGVYGLRFQLHSPR